MPHRNCKEIAAFLKFFVQHGGGRYLSGTEEDEQASHLPPGQLPVWVERSEEVTDEQVLEFIKENYLAETNLSGTVLYYSGDPIAAAKDWCRKHGWKYLDEDEITGSEDQCIVLMDGELTTEKISRGRNLLVIVTTRGKYGWVTLSSSHSMSNAGGMMTDSTLPHSTSCPPTNAQVAPILVTSLMAIAHTLVGSCCRR